MRRRITTTLLLVAALALATASCGADTAKPDPGSTPNGGLDDRRAEAERLIGTPEADLDLDTDLRIGRKGNEHMALTMDLREGRITVELDDVDGDWVITAAVLETREGTERFGDDAPGASPDAERLIGTPEADLVVGDLLRIGRRGAESFALTDDLRPGRATVELDHVDDEWLVTVVSLETESGSETLIWEELEPAIAILGTPEEDLETSELVRIGRRGDESFALTADLRPGRLTVELDEVDGAWIVTAASLESDEGSRRVAWFDGDFTDR